MERAEALHELRCFIGQLTEGCQEVLETIIPELKESEDERIRKWLVNYFTEIGENWIHREFTCEQIIAYLEKQKDHFREDTKMVEQKPAEWSEEDKSHLASIIGCIELCDKDTEDAASVLGYYDSDIAWLKSLRPSWKPSEEQMEALGRCVEYLEESDNEDTDILAVLYNQLKKLM